MKFLFFLLLASIISVTFFRLVLPPIEDEEEDYELPAEDENFETLLYSLLGPAGSEQQRAHDSFLAMGPLVLTRLTEVLSQELFLSQNPQTIDRLKALIQDFGLRSVPVLLDLLSEDGDDPQITATCIDLIRGFGSSALPVLLHRCELRQVSDLFPLLAAHKETALHALMQNLEKRPSDPRYTRFLELFGTEAEEALLQAVRSWTGGARRHAFLLLSRLASERAVPLFCEALGDTFPEVRVASVSALGRMKVTESMSLVLPLLHDKEPRVRRATLHTLLRWRHPSTLPFVERFLQERADHASSEVLLSRALQFHLGEEEALLPLRASLDSSPSWPTEVLLEVLRCFPPEEQRAPLEARFLDRRIHSRGKLLPLLETWSATEAASLLLRVHRSLDTADDFATEVEGALEAQDTSALPCFLSALKEERVSQRAMAFRWLLTHPHPSAVLPLLHYLEDSDLCQMYWELDLPLLRRFLRSAVTGDLERQAFHEFVLRHPESPLTAELTDLLPELVGSIVPKSALT